MSPINNSSDEKTDYNYLNEGYLVVKVYTASGFIPIDGATVNISGSDEQNSDFEIIMATDDSGATETISLPAPSPALSLSASSAQPYATYSIEIEKENFFSHMDFNVAIFSGITSIQSVYLIPKSMYRPQENKPNDILLNTETEETL